eukprot:4761539-Pyramimonas_sp.AAC.1
MAEFARRALRAATREVKLPGGKPLRTSVLPFLRLRAAEVRPVCTATEARKRLATLRARAAGGGRAGGSGV